MKSQIKKISDSKLEIEIEIPAKELDDYINQATLNLGKNLEVEGFRKGIVSKIPKEIIEKKVGKENILIEAADLAIKENYKKAVLENKIEPISQPEVEILKLAVGNPLIFRAKITILPEIKLPDYKKIASLVKRNKTVVEEKELKEALEWLRKSRAKFSLKNGPAGKGDFVKIEYQSSQIEELGQPQKLKDAFVLGEGHFIPGFEGELAGMKEGEEKKEIVLFIPINHPQKNLAGKKVNFQVKMESVQKVEFPEINDEFAKTLGKFENLNDLKESIKKGINREKEEGELQRVRDEILEKISQETKLETPEVLVQQEQERLMEDFREHISHNFKVSFTDYLAKYASKKTEKEIKDSLLPEAQKRVKNFLILREIGKKEQVEVSEKEIKIKEESDKMLKHYSNSEVSKKDFDAERLGVYTEGVIRNEKIFLILESFIRKS